MIEALHFDGRQARGVPVQLALDEHALTITPLDGSAATRVPLNALRWPERTRHGQRVIELNAGGSLVATDAVAFDAWSRAAGRPESWTVRVQQSWRGTLLATLLLVVLLAAGWRWGVPVAARAVLAALPPAVDRTVGEAAWDSVQSHWLQPSRLAAERQAQIRARWESALQSVRPSWPQGVPAHELRFRRGIDALGPNAFALPGGTIVVTDALADLLADADDALIGVLAHELGHVQRRHGMQLVVQFTLVSAAGALLLGDFSALLAAAPAVLTQAAYSRQAEREADRHAALFLRASGRSPAVMVTFFERLAARDARSAPLPVGLASHPPDVERVRYFREADRGVPD